MARLSIVLALSFLAACSDDGDSGAPQPTVLSSTVDASLINGADRSCEADADCVVIDADCCTCSSNGSRTAVNTSVAATVDDRRATTCEGALCQDAISNDDTCCDAVVAVCVDSICEVQGVVGAGGTEGCNDL